MPNQGLWPKCNHSNANMLANTKHNAIDFLCFQVNVKLIKNFEDCYLLFKSLRSVKEYENYATWLPRLYSRKFKRVHEIWWVYIML